MAKKELDTSKAVDVTFSGTLLEYKKKHIPYEYGYKEKDGQLLRFHKFNYKFGDAKKVIDKFFSILKEDGICKTSVIEILVDELKSPNYNIYKMFSLGKGALPLWEFLLALKVFDFRIELTDDGFELKREYTNKYRHREERNMLILESIKHPKFYISMNTENYKDFEVNFSANQSAMVDTENKCWRETQKILKWYFIKQAGKRKLPFDESIFKALFKLKYKNGEMKNTRKRKNKEDIDYGQYEQ